MKHSEMTKFYCQFAELVVINKLLGICTCLKIIITLITVPLLGLFRSREQLLVTKRTILFTNTNYSGRQTILEIYKCSCQELN